MTPSTSATVAPVGLPAEAKAQTAEGAEAFARWYVAETARALEIPDSANLRAVAGSCETCMDLAAVVDERRSKGEKYEKVTQEVGLSQVLDGTVGSTVTVGVLTEYTENFLLNAAGQRIARIKPEKAYLEVTVKWGQGWTVQSVERR